MLKIALPNKGSLSEGARNLVSAAGFKCRKNSKELLCRDINNNIEFVFLRPKDIAAYVDSGVFDFGITGRDIAVDSGYHLNEVQTLGFGRASMRYIIPNDQEYKGVQQFEGKTIACSYPGLVQNHLDENKVNAKIIKLDGAVEISIHLGIADAVADVVETGTTIKEAGLKAVGDPILKSEAVILAKGDGYKSHPEAETFLRRIRGILVARQYVMVEYDIPVAKLEEACKLCPGLESPTIAPLQDDSWRSVKVMVKSSEVNDIMDNLHDIGGRAILVTEIKSCRL